MPSLQRDAAKYATNADALRRAPAMRSLPPALSHRHRQCSRPVPSGSSAITHKLV